jgi:hypothetical protein
MLPTSSAFPYKLPFGEGWEDWGQGEGRPRPHATGW